MKGRLKLLAVVLFAAAVASVVLKGHAAGAPPRGVPIPSKLVQIGRVYRCWPVADTAALRQSGGTPGRMPAPLVYWWPRPSRALVGSIGFRHGTRGTWLRSDGTVGLRFVPRPSGPGRSWESPGVVRGAILAPAGFKFRHGVSVAVLGACKGGS